ncbi:hypothetical protein Aduo_017381 [Ancylostoma duodenale]
MKEVRSARDPEYKTLELDISEWESVKIMKRSEINPDDIVKKDFKVSVEEMCVRRKKSTRRSMNEPAKKKSYESLAAATPKAETPGRKGVLDEKSKEKQLDKDSRKDIDANDNMMAKPIGDAQLRDEKPKEPLHIKVPPPRVLKAKRAMKEVRSSRDPEYKTLELDISEWESAKIMRKSEINMDEIVRKEYKLQITQ